jgi:hypothetical protein
MTAKIIDSFVLPKYEKKTVLLMTLPLDFSSFVALILFEK